VAKVDFVAGSWQNIQAAGAPFDIVIAIFFLHHLPQSDLKALPDQLGQFLKPGGVFYASDPSARRLAGFLGELSVPKLMKKYQTENEHPLLPRATQAPFRAAGYETVTRWFDFTSTPVAGLFPGWRTGYRLGRFLDEGLTRFPILRELSSNFELMARRPVC
jgi:SAM-dependent methyltransferase